MFVGLSENCHHKGRGSKFWDPPHISTEGDFIRMSCTLYMTGTRVLFMVEFVYVSLHPHDVSKKP